MEIDITRADVREFVESTAADVNVDAVVSELVARLPLVGAHVVTTALNPTTIQPWIARQVREVLGVDRFGEILRESAE